jgi:hypothetical protein
MQVTGRVPRGYDTTGAAGGRVEPVLGFRFLGRCERHGLFERPADHPGEWRPAG